jgi:hypothetical protein
VVVIVGLLGVGAVARAVASSTERPGLDGSDDGCPTGRPSAAVDGWTENVTAPPLPGAATVYHLDIAVVVTNEADQPIVVRSVEVPIVNPPGQHPATGFPTEVTEVAPGATATLDAPVDIVAENGPVAPMPSGSEVRLTAEWADDELSACPI